tara:strand:+ start:1895 stop:2167 length:273 start_codon:yes stop_codon:yes gene_type:complete
LILHKIKCKSCGCQFKAGCTNRRYCSDECSKDAKKKTQKKNYKNWKKRVYIKRDAPLFEGLYVRKFTTPNDIYKDKQMEHAIQEIREKYP